MTTSPYTLTGAEFTPPPETLRPSVTPAPLGNVQSRAEDLARDGRSPYAAQMPSRILHQSLKLVQPEVKDNMSAGVRCSTERFLRAIGVSELPPLTVVFDPGYDPA